MTQPNATANVAASGVAHVNAVVVPAFYDVHLLLIDWLTANLGIRAVTELPPDLSLNLPLVQVQVIGGTQTSPATETVGVDIDAFVGPDAGGMADPASTSDLAERVRAGFTLLLPGYTTPDRAATVARVQVVSRPAPRPWDSSPIRRYQASYRLFMHSHV